MSDHSRQTMPGVLLRLEGLLLLASAMAIYALRKHDAVTMAVLFFAPDLSILAYLAGSRVGAAVYNAVHTYAVPLALAIAALVAGWSLGVQLALIWLAHIGMDRLMGFGLKYTEGFKQTHLGRV